MILAAIILLIWSQSIQNVSEVRERLDIGLLSIELSDLLLKQAGYSTSWESDDRNFTLGLAKEDHVLDEDKVDKFLSLNYDDTKILLGIGSYDYYFSLVNTSSKSVYNSSGQYPTNPDIAVNSRRIVMFNSTPFYMDFTIWR